MLEKHNNISVLKYQRMTAMLFLGTAFSLFDFWWTFYSEITEVLMPVFKHDLIENSYLEYKYFGFWLEATLAALMLITSAGLWFSKGLKLTKILALSCSLSSVVLGAGYLFTGMSSNFYSHAERYVSILFTLDISLVIVGILGLVLVNRS